VPNKGPSLINFSIFLQPPDLIRTPRLLILRRLTIFTNPSFHFLSVLVLFTPNFHGKIAYCCIYFSFMLYGNLFLFFLSLYNQLNPFLKFQPPPYILIPRLLHFGIFSNPSAYMDSPVYLALESTWYLDLFKQTFAEYLHTIWLKYGVRNKLY